MSGGEEAFALLLPPISSESIRLVRQMGRVSTNVSVCIPSNLDGLQLAIVEELLKHADEVFTFSTNPLQVSQQLEAVMLQVAAEFELAKTAVPIHYQNLRDRLRRRYDLRSLRDSQVLNILRRSESVTEVRAQVFKARVRHRGDAATAVIQRWCRLLSERVFDGIYDLPDYDRLLRQWLSLEDQAPDVLPISNTKCNAWLQFRSNSANAVFRTALDGELLRDESLPSLLSFSAAASLPILIMPFCEPLDESDLSVLRQTHVIRQKLSADDVSAKERMETVRQYARLWLNYIRAFKARGQEQKWRGWYLHPEHGPLTLGKLRELQLMIAKVTGLATGGTVLVDTSSAGVANANAILSAGRVKYAKKYSPRAKRDLFIRQQKNYLIRLGLVAELAPNSLAPTERGAAWLQMESDDLIRQAFLEIMEEMRWSWCSMPFFVFARRLADSLDGQLSYRELFNWTIHAYEMTQLPDLVRVISLYRSLSSAQRASVDLLIERDLESLLAKNVSAHAAGHYRTKVKDLMIAFATTGDFELTAGGERLKRLSKKP